MAAETAAELIEKGWRDLAELEAAIMPPAALLASYYRLKDTLQRAEAALEKERPE